MVVNYDHRSPRWLEALRDRIEAALWTVPGSLEAVTSGCGKVGAHGITEGRVKVPLPLTGPWQLVLVPRPRELAAVARGELVIVLGGDGAINEAVNGIMGRPAEAAAPLLAVIPGGGGNVFARRLGCRSIRRRRRPPRTSRRPRAPARPRRPTALSVPLPYPSVLGDDPRGFKGPHRVSA